MTVKEIAERFNCSTSHVNNMITRGKLKAQKLENGMLPSRYMHDVIATDEELEELFGKLKNRQKPVRTVVTGSNGTTRVEMAPAARASLRGRISSKDFWSFQVLAELMHVSPTTLHSWATRRNIKKYQSDNATTISKDDALACFDTYCPEKSALPSSNTPIGAMLETLAKSDVPAVGALMHAIKRVEAHVVTLEEKIDRLLKHLE